MDGTTDAWFDVEVAGCSLADERLNKRLRKLLAQLGSAMGQSIPLVCLFVPAYRAGFYDQLAPDWVIAPRFPSAADYGSAGNCFAVGENTACVFHLTLPGEEDGEGDPAGLL